MSYFIIITFRDGHTIKKNAGEDVSIANWILDSNKVEYRNIDCSVVLKKE